MTWEEYTKDCAELPPTKTSREDLQDCLLGVISELGRLARNVKDNTEKGKEIKVGDLLDSIESISYFLARFNSKFTRFEAISKSYEDAINEDICIKPSAFHSITCLIRSIAPIIMILEDYEGNNSASAMSNINYHMIFMLRVLNVLSKQCKTTLPKILKSNIKKLRKRNEGLKTINTKEDQ